MAVLGALILTFVIGEIWWFFLRQEPSAPTAQELLPPPPELQPLLPPAVETPLATEPEKPSGLLNYDRIQTLDPSSLTSLSGDIISPDELVKIAIAASDPATTLPTTLADVTSALKIKIPAAVSKELAAEFDIFGFGGNTFDQSECARAKNNLPQCWGPRLGLAIKVGDATMISGALRAWEKTIAADLKPMILAKSGAAATTAFQTGTYQGETIRYKNLPLNTITVEYVLVDDILLITTSKSSMLKAIDAINNSSDSDELSE